MLYRFFDAEDTLLYVGITNSPQSRYNNHRSDKTWFKHVVRSTMEHFPTRPELEAAEIEAIRSEKPKYNITHSVTSPPLQVGVKTRINYTTRSRDANRFPAPDGIASDDPSESETEARLDELEHQIATASQIIPMKPCPSCDLICLAREHDGLIKCLNCLSMWHPDEMPGDREILQQPTREQA